MRLRFYWNYAVRSLRRGGQRTVMAIFCIAVGVMAIVALQLASLMVSNNLTSNVRAANGGDISVTQEVIPLRQADLPFFDDLKRRHTIAQYTALTRQTGTALHGSQLYPITVGVVDPAVFPLAGQPNFTQPSHGDLHGLLAPRGAVVLSTLVADTLHVKQGDHVTINGSGGRTFDARIAGLIANSATFGGGTDAYVSRPTYQQGANGALTYSVVYITTSSDAQTKQAEAQIKQRFPLATVQTVADALKARQNQTQLVHNLLQVVGILALLIGGFGVVNTMSVLLARRRVEIAMLKTSGYKRRDLYMLFGVEAALLGILGGAVGAVIGIALSWVVKTLIENAFQLHLPFVIDPGAVLMGVLVGLVTALIFGLQPIARAAFVRPQAVLREVTERPSWGTRLGSAALFLLLSVLFCVLASVILGSALWGIAVVYGTFFLLGLLSIFFALLVWIIGRLPVPERLGLGQAALATLALLIAVAITVALPPVGIVLILVAVLGYGVAFLPRPWKATIKMSLRNIGRQRTRATMTLLALFVGVFSVGLMVILGQDVRDTISTALSSQLDYNVVSISPVRFAPQLERQIPHLPGLKKYQSVAAAQVAPLSINGQSLVSLLQKTKASRGPARASLGVNGTLALLSGLGGYDLAAGQSTGATVAKGDGRNLNAGDAGTTNVLIESFLHTLGPLHLQLGDRITVTDEAHAKSLTVRIVGFYTTGLFDTTHFEPILAPRTMVRSFAGLRGDIIYTLKVDPKKADAAVTQLNRTAPHAITLNLTNLGAIVDQILGNLVILLVALASLALFAGVIIIANAVALAMLARRREQGILKSVGYTSGRVLSGVLIENGVIGGLGGVLGMLLVALATTLLANNIFKTSLALPGPTILGLILLVTVIALVTSALVSWRAVRVRPLEVLRYE